MPEKKGATYLEGSLSILTPLSLVLLHEDVLCAAKRLQELVNVIQSGCGRKSLLQEQKSRCLGQQP